MDKSRIATPAVTLPCGPSLDVTSGDTYFVAQAAHGAVPARVWLGFRDFGADTRFTAVAEDESPLWRVRLPRPPVDRFEYLLTWRHADGHESTSIDPANPKRVPGVFGDHSVVEYPEYREPEWCQAGDAANAMGVVESVGLSDSDSGVAVAGELWAPHGSTSDELLPLLVANDGREYAQFGDLLGYVGWLGRARPELRCRVMLLDPVNRDRSYSASPAYGRMLTRRLLPELRARFRTRGAPVGMGASLGAVAILQAASSDPGTFGGVLLQSGSFFTEAFDAHESGFRFYPRLLRFTSALDAQPERYDGLEVVMTCGTGEENLHNNRAATARLAAVGVNVTLAENRDAHNYIAWRNCWEPHLSNLFSRVWCD